MESSVYRENLEFLLCPDADSAKIEINRSPSMIYPRCSSIIRGFLVLNQPLGFTNKCMSSYGPKLG